MIYFGSFYIVIGTIFLFVPLIYLELGRPKDLIKASINLLIGFILIITNNVIYESFFIILILLTILVFLYVLELFLSRWNQLTNKEKNKLLTFVEFRNSISKILEAINLALMNLTKTLNFFNLDINSQKISKKKSERNIKNDNIKVGN